MGSPALAQPTANATLARLSQVHNGFSRPYADTTALRKSQVEEERRIRQGYAALVLEDLDLSYRGSV